MRLELNESYAAATTEHMGKTYWFCNPGCKEAFDKNPGEHLSGKSEGHHGGHH